MTVIAAVVRDGQVHMASDTGGQMDGSIYYHPRKTFALAAGDESVGFGFAGLGALGALVKKHLKIDAAPAPCDDHHDWAVTISEAICDIAVEAKPALTAEQGWVDGCAVMGFRGQMWLLSQQDALEIMDPFTAIGSGSDLAIGALSALQAVTDLHPRVALELAIAAACKYDSGCSVNDAGMRYLVV